MKLSKVLFLFCCPNGAKGVTSTLTNLALQEYGINRQITRNKHGQAVRHRSGQAMGLGQAMSFAELLSVVKNAQIAVDAHRRVPSNARRFGPKIGGRIRSGTMKAFRRMLKVVGTYLKH